MKKIFFVVPAFFVLYSGVAQNKNHSNNEISFEVDKVRLAKKYLKEQKLDSAVKYKIQKEIKFLPPTQQNLRIIPTKNNAFIQTVQNCYDEHRPLILTPDIIWLAITQAVSIHLNQNLKEYQIKIFKDTSNSTIEIRKRDDSLSFQKDNWSKILTTISEEVNNNVNKNYYSFFVPKFSTSTQVVKTAFEITMLDAFKKKFTYVGESGCGIPTITIKGTIQDWQWIYDNLHLLNDIGLGKWADELKLIIEQFINASKGRIDRIFWQNIYKNSEEYNSYFISGWVVKLFPYLEDTEDAIIAEEGEDNYDGLLKFKQAYKKNPFLYNQDYLKSTLATNDFPSGLSSINFRWDDFFREKITHLNFYAGFMGIKQYKNKALETFISWAITDTFLLKKTANSRFDEAMFIHEKLKHNEDYWSPHFARKVTDSAVYDIKRFKTTQASLAYVKQILVNSINGNGMFVDSIKGNKIIAIEILSNGSIGNVYSVIKKNGDEEWNKNVFRNIPLDITNFELYVKHILQSLPNKWFPAIAHPTDVFEYLSPDEGGEIEKRLKVKANSTVEIVL